MPKKPMTDDVAPPPASPGTGGGKKKRVLIVEDEKPLAHALELKMTHEGCEVHVALTGADGLKEATSGAYDLILLDLIMPELDGFAVLQALKEKSSKTPVMVLSNLGQDEDKQKALDLGAKEYFVKANTPIMDIVQKAKSFL